MWPTAQCVYGGQLLPLAGEPMEPKGGLLAVVLPHDLGLGGSRYDSLTGERLTPRARVHEPLAVTEVLHALRCGLALSPVRHDLP